MIGNFRYVHQALLPSSNSTNAPNLVIPTTYLPLCYQLQPLTSNYPPLQKLSLLYKRRPEVSRIRGLYVNNNLLLI